MDHGTNRSCSIILALKPKGLRIFAEGSIMTSSMSSKLELVLSAPSFTGAGGDGGVVIGAERQLTIQRAAVNNAIGVFIFQLKSNLCPKIFFSSRSWKLILQWSLRVSFYTRTSITADIRYGVRT